MPRIGVTLTIVDDENRPLARESWSPLAYEDLGNPNLAVVESTLVNAAERELLERLHTSIDRSLLVFSRRERRRFRPQAAQPEPDNPDIFEDDMVFPIEYMGEFLPDLRDLELTEPQRMAIIRDQLMVEDQRVPEPQKISACPIKRVSRYKRDPVI